MEVFLVKSCISEKKRKIYLLSGITFWILVWWVMSIFVGEKLFLPSPFTVIKTMLFLLGEKEFWSDISFSAVRVIISYGLSFVLALAFGVVGGCYEKVDILLSPLVKAMRSIPVSIHYRPYPWEYWVSQVQAARNRSFVTRFSKFIVRHPIVGTCLSLMACGLCKGNCFIRIDERKVRKKVGIILLSDFLYYLCIDILQM